ncbi:DNA repair protein RecO [Thiohalocapsa marina]|uniref:DNA repair protein RecO n=1 Tax=Thiohalocapsa marina TaxID=424902 RepID=A0A5M8FR04_9GAMM|nr:DNA repair protein RecO [Thiohalocapsa marina]KAA6185751.1 DNA repair protein RecO [Thiohalocapsa marina]
MFPADRDRLQPGFVLHRRDYSDSSLLLEVFTGEHGRLPLLAKGAKRGRAPSAALLQPFTPLLLAWRGRGEVQTLVRVEPAGRPVALVGDALYCGFYVNELLTRLLGRQDPHERLFLFYQMVLQELAASRDLDTPLRRFELRLLAELGYAVELDRDAEQGLPVQPHLYYVYSHERGLLPALSPQGDGAVSGATLQCLSRGEALSGSQAREARRLLRALLAPYLGDRPLRSRALFAARPRRPAGT